MTNENPSIRIRRYEVGEEASIWNVVYQATHVANSRDYHPDLIERWAPHDKDIVEWAERLKNRNPFVAVIDSELVGMAELVNDGHIDYFYVHPEFHRRGIGSELLATIEAEAVRSGFQRLTANVSMTAKPFFLSKGFSIVESRRKVILGHPAPQFVMEKPRPQ